MIVRTGHLGGLVRSGIFQHSIHVRMQDQQIRDKTAGQMSLNQLLIVVNGGADPKAANQPKASPFVFQSGISIKTFARA